VDGEQDAVKIECFESVAKSQPDGFSAVALAPMPFFADKNADEGIPVDVVDVMQADMADGQVAVEEYHGETVPVQFLKGLFRARHRCEIVKPAIVAANGFVVHPLSPFGINPCVACIERREI
jgi:hypothetical protein